MEPIHPLFWHTIDTAEIAPVRYGDPEVRMNSPKRINQIGHWTIDYRH